MPDRILVVDDEEAIREIVCAILAAAGYSWKQASSGMEALAVLNSGETFELMLSDLMMADLDGIGLLERTKERFPDMPVVMVTAVHDISVALAAIRNGAYDYLLKPFEREQLLNAVGRALENRRLKVENRTYQTNLEALVRARTDELRAAMADLERSYDTTLETLGDALDLKDAETGAHTRRVTAFTIAIARAMGVPREQILVIARGAFLHDIGKMAISVVVIENDLAEARDQQVFISVVVVVGCGHCDRIHIRIESGLRSDIGKVRVTIVAIKMVVRRRVGLVLQGVGVHRIVERAAAHHIERGKAGVVVVEPDAASAGPFEQRPQLGGAKAVRKVDVGWIRGVFESNRR